MAETVDSLSAPVLFNYLYQLYGLLRAVFVGIATGSETTITTIVLRT